MIYLSCQRFFVLACPGKEKDYGNIIGYKKQENSNPDR